MYKGKRRGGERDLPPPPLTFPSFHCPGGRGALYYYGVLLHSLPRGKGRHTTCTLPLPLSRASADNPPILSPPTLSPSPHNNGGMDQERPKSQVHRPYRLCVVSTPHTELAFAVATLQWGFLVGRRKGLGKSLYLCFYTFL